MKIDARGKTCPLPVIEAKNALNDGKPGDVVAILVDNEIAVQNLIKMAEHKNLAFTSTKEGEDFLVKIMVGAKEEEALRLLEKEETSSYPKRKGMVAALGADHMGEGDETLGRLLMKGYLYALTQLEVLPETLLFYNGGAALTCEGSASLEDLFLLRDRGVEILTCGTCLNYYGLEKKLAVGSVTNMYEIAQRMGKAETLIRP